MINFFYGEVDAKNIVINKKELSSRLMAKQSDFPSAIDNYEALIRESVNAKYSAKIVDIIYKNKEIIIDGISVKSTSLSRNLNGCDRCIVLCVTLGHLVDKTLLKYSVKSTYEHFILDAIASALSESLCDLVDKKLTKNYKTKNRFSVGYGDLSLEYQKSFLKIVEADKYLSVNLSSSLLMSPTKTITAIIGIENEYIK